VAAGFDHAGPPSFQAEDKMRTETETVVNDIRESLSLLRRHL
jgi:hypothetical protein